jgi:LysR family transcriptional activator of glutamate synthase operon
VASIAFHDQSMELRQLTYFEAVARLGGFTRAARELRVAQSAVSAQVAALERELGATLIARTTRQVRLTRAGELFLARARRALAELDSARGELADLTATLRGQVTLGATSILGPLDLPAALVSFHDAYPGITVRLRSALIAKLLDKLDAGEVDLVLGPMHEDLPARFAARRIAPERLVVALPPGHRLGTRAKLTLADLSDESFVCLSADSGLRAILDAAGAEAGFTPHVPFETHSPASIRELVSAGLGVALLAASAATGEGRPIGVREVHPSPRHPPIGLIRHRDRRLTAAAQACSRHLLTSAGAGG